MRRRQARWRQRTSWLLSKGFVDCGRARGSVGVGIVAVKGGGLQLGKRGEVRHTRGLM